MSRPPALTRPRRVVRVHPAGRGHARPEFGPGQVGDMPAVLLRRVVPEVAERVGGNGRVEVVRAEHEHAGPVQQRAEPLKQRLNGPLVRDRVPGVHDEIRGKRIQGPEPRQQPVPSGGQVDVGQVQHPQRFGARRQNRYLGPAQGEPVPFQDAAVAERRTACHGGQGEGAQGCSHPPMVPCAGTRRGQSAQARGYLARRGRLPGRSGSPAGGPPVWPGSPAGRAPVQGREAWRSGSLRPVGGHTGPHRHADRPARARR